MNFFHVSKQCDKSEKYVKKFKGPTVILMSCEKIHRFSGHNVLNQEIYTVKRLLKDSVIIDQMKIQNWKNECDNFQSKRSCKYSHHRRIHHESNNLAELLIDSSPKTVQNVYMFNWPTSTISASWWIIKEVSLIYMFN